MKVGLNSRFLHNFFKLKGASRNNERYNLIDTDKAEMTKTVKIRKS